MGDPATAHVDQIVITMSPDLLLPVEAHALHALLQVLYTRCSKGTAK